jgi:hypothetical protein
VNSFKNIGSMIGSAAVVAAIVGLTAGLAPASAAPQQSPGVTLTIKGDPANPGNSILRIEGTFPMSEGDSHDRVNNMTPGGGMDYIVHADDPGDDRDYPIGMPHGYIGMPGPDGGFMTASPFGIRFLREISVPKGELDEDFCFSSGCGDDTDEVYVKVRFVQGNGAGDLAAYTNAISGKFGPRFG